MKNVLLVALTIVMKKHKKQYMLEHGIQSVVEATQLIAEQCNISYNTLRTLESSSYIPSRDVTTRLLQSGIYPFTYSNFISLLAVIELMGKEMRPQSFDKVLSAVSNDPELYTLVTSFSDAFSDEALADNLIPYHLYEYGLIRAVEDYLIPLHRSHYYAKFIDNEDVIPQLVDIWQKLTPEVAPSVESFRQGWLRNKASKTVIYRDNTCKEVMGFYSLIPLSEAGLEGILDCSIQSGSDMIIEEHIAPSFSECSSIFVGMIAGLNRYCASYVISEMMSQIIPMLNHTKATNVTARGRTLQGKAIMQRFSFEKIKGSEMSICYLTDSWMDKHKVQRILSYR